MFRVKLLLSSLLIITVLLFTVDSYAQSSLEELYASKKFTEAYQVGIKLLKKSPKDIKILKLTASSATETFLEKEGTELFLKATKLSPKDAEVFYLYGMHFGKFGRRKEEAQQYKKALELRPEYSEVYSAYSYALLKIGQHALSDSISTLALKVSSKDSRAKLSKATSNAILGNLYEARIHFKELLSVEPNNREALLNFGIFEMSQNNYSEAMKRFEKILEFEPNDLDAKIRIGTVYFRLGLKSESKAYLQKLQKEYPNEIQLLKTIAEIEMSSGNFELGKTLYYQVMNLDSTNPESYLKMNEIYSNLKLTDSCIIVLQKGVSFFPDNIYLLLELGKVYGNANKYKEAVVIYKKIDSIQPNYIQNLFHLALAYQKNGFSEEALTYVNKAISLTKSIDTICYLNRMKAEIMISKGDYIEATKIYLSITEINPLDVLSWYNLGIIYVNKNDQEKAKLYLEKALELSPNFVDCRKIYIRFLAGQKKYEEAIKQCVLLRDSDPFGAEEYTNAIKELMTQ